MKHEQALALARRIESRFKTGMQGPFPYADCRSLLGPVPDSRYEGLIPDIDIFVSTIAGYAQTASRLLNFTREGRASARTDLARSFQEQHPLYSDLLRGATSEATPSLFLELSTAEELRLLLLELLSLLDPT